MKETLLQGFLSAPYFLRPSEVFSLFSLETERSLVSISTTVLISTLKRPTLTYEEGLAQLVSARPYGKSRVRFRSPGVTSNLSFDFFIFHVALNTCKTEH